MPDDTRKKKSELIRELQQLRRQLKASGEAAPTQEDTLQEAVVRQTRVERALQESKEKYRKLLEQASDGICIVQNMTLIYCNPQFAEILGMSPEELSGAPVSRYLDPTELPEELALHESRMAGKKVPQRYERTLIRRDGTPVQVEVNISLITHANQQASLVIARDITERKVAEREVRKSYRQLVALNTIHNLLLTCRSGEDLCDRLAHFIRTILPVDAFILDAYDPDRGEAYGFGNYDIIDGEFCRAEISPYVPGWHEGQFHQWLFVEKRTVVIHRTQEEILHPHADFYPFGDTSRRSASMLYIPLMIGGRVCGVFSIQSYSEEAYGPEQVHLAEAIGRQIAPAIEGILLAEKLKRSAGELRRSEEYLRAFIEALPDVAFIMDEDGRYIDILSTNDQLLMKGKSKVKGTLLSQHFSPEETGRFLETIRKTIETNQFHVCEYEVDMPDGPRWFEGRTTPMKIRTAEGRATIVWIARDITLQKNAEQTLKQARDYLEIRVRERTAELEALNRDLKREILERRQVEAALRKSEARYRGLIESQEDLVARIDREDRFTFVNDAFCRKFGQKRHQLLGRSFSEMMQSDEIDLGIRSISSLQKPPFRSSIEKPIVTAEGRRWIHWETCAIRNNRNEIQEYQAVGRDVTGFRLAVQAMQESERKYRSLYENASDAIFLTNREGMFLDVNPAMCRLTGFTEEQLLQMNMPSIAADASIWPNLQNAVEGAGGVQDFEVQLWRKDGTRVDCHVTANLHRDADGVILGYQGIARDITERKQAEKERSRLDRMQREFVANVSHELKTPLTSIQGYAETLISGSNKDPKTVRDFLEIIQDNAVRLSRLTDDLLQLSQIEAGHLKMEMRQLNPVDLIDGCLKIIRPKAGRKKITLQSDYADPLPSIRGDSYRLREVFQNLLDNAVHYSPDASTIRIRLRPREKRWLQFDVIDEGIGIAPEDQERIFERFFRVDTARSRKAGGTGLGLPIVRQLVEAHEGRIELKSQPGRGTTFSVLLPVNGPD